ncbi:MAG: type II toxin-antitoxin system VapC family toxin [Sphingomicrobium sp.]
MTEPRALLDSNCCIYIIEGVSETLRRQAESYAPGELVTSAIAYAEVALGVDRNNPHHVENFERLFELIPVLAFDQSAAEHYAALPFERHRFDNLIAAHALALGVPVATANVKHFAGIAGLRVEDWTQ